MDIIKSIKEEINYNLDNLDLEKIVFIKDLILNNNNNNIYFSGIGKCETIAIHISNLLKSLSYKSFYINVQNSSHGDIGVLDENSIVILFSKSGNTQELINFIEIAKLKKTKIISVTCNNESKIKNKSDFHYYLPLKTELNYGIINIPTNSCILMLIFCNILVKLLDNINIEDYKINHIGGSIGNELKKIKNIMEINYPRFVYDKNLKIMDIVLKMTEKKIGLAVINDINGKIIGIITDGDIRRFFINYNKIEYLKEEYINKDFFKYNDKELIIKDIKNNLLKHKYIPILDFEDKCIGILNENIIKKYL